MYTSIKKPSGNVAPVKYQLAGHPVAFRILDKSACTGEHVLKEERSEFRTFQLLIGLKNENWLFLGYIQC